MRCQAITNRTDDEIRARRSLLPFRTDIEATMISLIEFPMQLYETVVDLERPIHQEDDGVLEGQFLPIHHTRLVGFDLERHDSIECRGDDCILVREILIERTLRDARPLGDAIRRNPIGTALLEYLETSLDDGVDRRLRAALAGLLAGCGRPSRCLASPFLFAHARRIPDRRVREVILLGLGGILSRSSRVECDLPAVWNLG